MACLITSYFSLLMRFPLLFLSGCLVRIFSSPIVSKHLLKCSQVELEWMQHLEPAALASTRARSR